MRIPTLAVRSLTLAIGLGLAVPSSASDSYALPSHRGTAALATGPAANTPSTLITFGHPGQPWSTAEGGVAKVPAHGIDAADIDRLQQAPIGTVLATLASSELPLSDTDAQALKQLFDRGIPFLLTMDSRDRDHLAQAASLFGIAPTTGDALLRREERGAVSVFSSKAGDATAPSVLMSAMLAGVASPDPMNAGFQGRFDKADLLAENTELAPGRQFHAQFVDERGEVSGVTEIDVARSYTRSRNLNLIRLTSKATTAPARNGVVDGGLTKRNLWATYLPHEYRLKHSLTADGASPIYLDHFPETDGRTEYTQTDTDTHKFSVGGSTGAELSATGKPSDPLAAKVPFNASLGYEHTWGTTLSMTFMDYSVLAVPGKDHSVHWKALIAPRLKNVLVKRAGANGMPQLSEEKMTPMMRTATFNAMSLWSIDGTYEGLVKIGLSAGYTLDEKEWWWDRTRIRYRNQTALRDSTTDFVLDMSDPYITPEITVLIRSAVGTGSCLRDNNGNVDLAPCNSADRRQMWGLNATSQYVNRKSRQCLATQPITRSVVTVPCQNPNFEKQWQWRADRLHSLSDHGGYRLYVENNQVHYYAPEGRFQDYPVNPYGAPLEPWTNYPNSPRPGIDYQPAPAGGRPLPIGDDWASKFRPVSSDQRWRIEVLRQGL